MKNSPNERKGRGIIGAFIMLKKGKFFLSSLKVEKSEKFIMIHHAYTAYKPPQAFFLSFVLFFSGPVSETAFSGIYQNWITGKGNESKPST